MENAPQSKNLPIAPKIATIALGVILAGCTPKDNTAHTHDPIENESSHDLVDNHHYQHTQLNLLNSPTTEIIDPVSGQVLTTFTTDNVGNTSINITELEAKMDSLGMTQYSIVYITSNGLGAIILDQLVMGIQERIFSITSVDTFLNKDPNFSSVGLVASREVLRGKRDDYIQRRGDTHINFIEDEIDSVSKKLNLEDINSDNHINSSDWSDENNRQVAHQYIHYGKNVGFKEVE